MPGPVKIRELELQHKLQKMRSRFLTLLSADNAYLDHLSHLNVPLHPDFGDPDPPPFFNKDPGLVCLNPETSAIFNILTTIFNPFTTLFLALHEKS